VHCASCYVIVSTSCYGYNFTYLLTYSFNICKRVRLLIITFVTFFYGIAYILFYMGCMVNEITRFYCKPDMTSSLFRRQEALHAIFHDGFWQSDYDFLIVIRSNILSEITRFYCQPDMRSSSVLHQGALHAIFLEGFWKSDHEFLIASLSDFLSGMHGFRDNEVLLHAGYDVVVISPPGVASRYFTWRILKKRPWHFICDAWFPR